MTQSSITESQAAVLRFLVQFKAQHRFMPTMREIATHFGYRSPTGVREHLRRLEMAGRIRLTARRARAMEIVGVDGDRAVELLTKCLPHLPAELRSEVEDELAKE